MGMLFEQSSLYLRDRRFYHPPRLLLLLRREMLPKLITLALMLKRMDKRGRENLLPVGNLFLHCEGDPRQFEEVGLLDDNQILLHVDVRSLLFVVRAESPYRRGETPPRRRPASPVRGRSPSSPPRRHRSPARASPRRMRGSPVRRRSPLPPRQPVILLTVLNSPPRRARSPPRRSPVSRRRSRSPIRRPARSRSRSVSPRRGRAPGARRGRSSSYSGSPSPRKVTRKVSRSRSPRRPLRGRSSSNSSSSSSPPHDQLSVLGRRAANVQCILVKLVAFSLGNLLWVWCEFVGPQVRRRMDCLQEFLLCYYEELEIFPHN
ncbi:hypothetical protein L1049_022085 [Liquidambar formosana]|uniref:Uncharacterized protein n=1 Tax=Liquidambar formosana TaxID=63359 RepID=A0AAP0RD68_LIQFO